MDNKKSIEYRIFCIYTGEYLKAFVKYKAYMHTGGRLYISKTNARGYMTITSSYFKTCYSSTEEYCSYEHSMYFGSTSFFFVKEDLVISTFSELKEFIQTWFYKGWFTGNYIKYYFWDSEEQYANFSLDHIPNECFEIHEITTINGKSSIKTAEIKTCLPTKRKR